jgi:hypothetical protein
MLFHHKKLNRKVIKVGSDISEETLMISRKQLINLPALIHQRAGMVWQNILPTITTGKLNFLSRLPQRARGGGDGRGQACEREQSNTFLLVFLKSAALDLVIFTHFSPHAETQGAHRPAAADNK